jgi:catechol 2,3-dioxygenase-like lactoylglutathione lyase family enzyme
MARIKHIALTTADPAKTAAFYKEAFGLKELRRSPNGAVFLTDGYIHVAVLNLKDNRSADVGAHGENFTGIHHFGFEVDDLGAACKQLETAHAERLTAKAGDEAAAYAEVRAGHANFEMKWAGPDGVVIDISHTGWEGTH